MRLALLLGLLAFVNTCQDDDVDPNGKTGETTTCLSPGCMDQRIYRMMSEPPTAPRASVTFIRTKNTIYYYLPTTNELLDYQCNVVCNPDGGVAAREKGDCPEITNEIERYTYWEDDRK